MLEAYYNQKVLIINSLVVSVCYYRRLTSKSIRRLITSSLVPKRNMDFFKVCVLVSLMAVGLALSDAWKNEICCPMGWLGYGGHCYRYFTYKKNFSAARSHCHGLGADLVSIHSSIENDIINGLSSGEEVSWLHIYLSKLLIFNGWQLAKMKKSIPDMSLP